MASPTRFPFSKVKQRTGRIIAMAISLRTSSSTNQEIFLDQSQFISVVLLVFSLVFSCCVSVFLGIVLYLILLPVSVFVQKLSQPNEKSRVISCYSLFNACQGKQTWLLLNFVSTIDFTSSPFSVSEKRQQKDKSRGENCDVTRFSIYINTISYPFQVSQKIGPFMW